MPKKANAMLAEIRRQEMLEIVNSEGRVTVNSLSKKFNVSPATIRADLSMMELDGLLKRAHGGALSIVKSDYELTSREKFGLHNEEKRAIARLAKNYVTPGAVIGIDTGTTTIEFAKQILNIPNLTVITNDLKIALMLEERSSHTVILLGGSVRKSFHCTVGQSVIDSLDSFRINVSFLATNAIDLDWGLSTPKLDVANVKSKLIKNSKQTILLADSSKFGQDSLARFANIKDVDVLITDSKVDRKYTDAIQNMGVEVVTG